MNDKDAEYNQSILTAYEWSRDELESYINALNWLHQAANGQTPHGDCSWRSANNAANPWKKETTLPNPTVPENSITPTVIGTATGPDGQPSGTSGTETTNE